jgi:hypothetical protein
MDEETPEFWGQLVTQLGLPEDLRQHIETMATRAGVSPWDYILAVLRRDAEHSGHRATVESEAAPGPKRRR